MSDDVRRLREALVRLLGAYEQLLDCGDCGSPENWRDHDVPYHLARGALLGAAADRSAAPEPCWCPYCGEPHGYPAKRRTVNGTPSHE